MITKKQLEEQLAALSGLDISDSERAILAITIQSQIDERADEVVVAEPAPEAPAESAPVAEAPVDIPSEPDVPASPEAPVEPEAPAQEPSPEAPIEAPVEQPAPAEPAPEVAPEAPVAKAQWPSDEAIAQAGADGGEAEIAMDSEVIRVYAAKKLGN